MHEEAPSDVAILQSEIDRLQQENNELKKEAERFVYAVSHDLQEPLRNLTGFCKVLEDDFAAELPKEAAECVAFIGSSSARLQAMVKGLLALSRIKQTEPAPSAVDLDQLVEEALWPIRTAFAGKVIHCSHPPLPKICVDVSLLSLVFTEVLRNAVLYGKDDQAAAISVEINQHGDTLALNIRDQGIGFAPEQTERVFDVFQRLVPRSKYAGIGMGLALCRAAMARMGGEITATAKAGEGACFSLIFPGSVLQPTP